MRIHSIGIVAAVLAFGALVNSTAIAMTGKERQAQCSTEWKTYKSEHGTPAKGEGRAAWNKFRSDCTKRLKASDTASK